MSEVPRPGPRELAERLSGLRNELASMEAEKKEVQTEHDRVEAALFDMLENAGLRSVKVDGLGVFSLNDLAWAKVIDEALARQWADEAMPELLTLNRSRLSVVVRDALKEGHDLPAGVEFTTTRKITWRKP